MAVLSGYPSKFTYVLTNFPICSVILSPLFHHFLSKKFLKTGSNFDNCNNVTNASNTNIYKNVTILFGWPCNNLSKLTTSSFFGSFLSLHFSLPLLCVNYHQILEPI